MFSEELKMSGLTNKPANIYNLHVDETGLITELIREDFKCTSKSHIAMPTWSPPLQGKHRFQCSSVAMQQDNSYRLLFSTRHSVHAPPGWKEVRPELLTRLLHLAGWNFQFLKKWFEKTCFPELKKRHPIEPTILLLTDTGLTWHSRLQASKSKTTSRSSSHKSCSSTTGRSFQATQDKVTRDFESVCSRIAYELNGQGDFPSSVFKVMERI